MTGPGEYVPEVTEGITRVEDLPRPRLERRSRNWPALYSVRTKDHVEQRLALDMQREQRAPKRQQTVKTLHRARSKPASLH